MRVWVGAVPSTKTPVVATRSPAPAATGPPMPFSQVAIANSLAQQLSRLEQEFGLTPSARTRITVLVQPTNKLDKY